LESHPSPEVTPVLLEEGVTSLIDAKGDARNLHPDLSRPGGQLQRPAAVIFLLQDLHWHDLCDRMIPLAAEV